MEFMREKNRISHCDAEGNTLAEILFPAINNHTVEITHTFVDPSLAGQGIAAQLTAAAVDELRGSHRQARLTCSYALQWFRQHPEAQDVLENPASLASDHK